MAKFIRKTWRSFLMLSLAWVLGLAYFTTLVPDTPMNPGARADAIVVLTGGSGRLELGLKLLRERRGRQLFISGVSPNTTLEDLLKLAGTDASRYPPNSIIIGHEAVSTIGNALETSQWLEQQDYKSVILVTSAYHMPRSLQEFRQEAPGVTLIPAPVFSESANMDTWWLNDQGRSLVFSEYTKYLLGKFRHIFVFLTRTHKPA